MDIEQSWVPRGCGVPDSQKKLEDKHLCVVMSINGDLHLFLIGLEGLDEGCSRRSLAPNLIIPGILGDLQLCESGNCLYIFLVESFKRCAPKAYKIGLGSLAPMCHVKLEKTMLEGMEKTTLLGPKSTLQVIPYHVEGHGTVMIVFSALIFCCDRDSDRDDGCDFEIFDPKGVLSRKLPQLLISPKSQSGQTILLLHHSPSGICVSQEFAPTKPFSHENFWIMSFGLNGSQFLIKTEFGNMFSLGLRWTNNEWRVCEEGIEIQSPGMNFVIQNRFCFGTCGINEFRANSMFWRSWQAFIEKYEAKRCPDIGVSSIRKQCCDDLDDIIIYGGYYSYTVAFLDSYPNHINEMCMPCVSQVRVSRESRKNLYWFLDLFKIDLHKLALEAKYEESDEDENRNEGEGEEEENDQFVEHIISMQFDVPYINYILSASIVAMFPFYYH